MEKIIARCGLSCSTCDAYLATQQNDQEWLKRVAEAWTKEYHATFTPETVMCDSCLADTGRLASYCHVCEIRACAGKHEVVNCAYCSEYPCAKLESFLATTPTAKANLEEVRASL
jgi:hypothetical protein